MKIVNVCGRIVGVRQMSVSGLYERRVTQKAKMTAMNPGHVLATHYQLLPSGRRYRMAMASTARARRSFISRPIQAVNGHQLV